MKEFKVIYLEAKTRVMKSLPVITHIVHANEKVKFFNNGVCELEISDRNLLGFSRRDVKSKR